MFATACALVAMAACTRAHPSTATPPPEVEAVAPIAVPAATAVAPSVAAARDDSRCKEPSDSALYLSVVMSRAAWRRDATKIPPKLSLTGTVSHLSRIEIPSGGDHAGGRSMGGATTRFVVTGADHEPLEISIDVDACSIAKVAFQNNDEVVVSAVFSRDRDLIAAVVRRASGELLVQYAGAINATSAALFSAEHVARLSLTHPTSEVSQDFDGRILTWSVALVLGKEHVTTTPSTWSKATFDGRPFWIAGERYKFDYRDSYDSDRTSFLLLASTEH